MTKTKPREDKIGQYYKKCRNTDDKLQRQGWSITEMVFDNTQSRRDGSSRHHGKKRYGKDCASELSTDFYWHKLMEYKLCQAF